MISPPAKVNIDRAEGKEVLCWAFLQRKDSNCLGVVTSAVKNAVEINRIAS